MPYIQPATNNIFGLMPVEGIPGHGQTALYPVSSSEATAILPGDCVVRTSIGTLRAAVSADSLHMIGAAAAPLSTADFAQGTLNLLVYDDPLQYFVCTAASSAVVTQLMIGQNMALVTTATGTGIPSTLVGRSKMALSPTATTSAGILRLINIHPIDVWTSSDATSKKYIVKAAPASDFASNLTT